MRGVERLLLERRRKGGNDSRLEIRFAVELVEECQAWLSFLARGRVGRGRWQEVVRFPSSTRSGANVVRRIEQVVGQRVE